MAAFGGIIASSVVKEVIGKLASPVWQQIDLHWNFKNDMKDMKDNLESIQAVLEDAERKSLTDKSVCLWLKKLKCAAYDIEDMMCDFEIEIPSKKEGALGEWLKQFKHSAMMGKKRLDLVKQMKEMRERLSNIAAQRSQFVLSTQNSFNMESVVKERATFSTVNENTILGRDDEKAVLMKYLKQSNDGENPFIIAIVGLGGIGKTTIARLIYNDAWAGAFDNQGWVYVSMEFDLVKIGKALLESFGGTQQEVSGNNLETITKNLKGKISGKKYFIVLDDLWEENGMRLNQLQEMLRGGINGSKIIVTTRSRKVAELIGADKTHKIKVLSDEYCWELFSQKAFTSTNEKINNDLEVIGKKIGKKCGAIPLAAIALGYTMRLKKKVHEWLEVENSNFWKLTERSVNPSTTDIMPSLKLSYYFMPSDLKLCFGYCSILSKGYSVSKKDLIQQWIALDFIPTMDGISLEMRGEWYVDDLLSMSFLQPHTSYTSDVQLKLHDVVHDLARSVIGNELFVLDTKKMDHNIADHYRYAFFPHLEGLTIAHHTMLSKLRAINWDGYAKSYDAKENKIDFVVHAKYLRVLYLSLRFRSTTMPDSIGKLKQLRYICARYTNMEVLPESFGDLINLRYLCMSGSHFKKLPVSFRNLTNLEVLVLNDCGKLECLPEPLKLVRLQELYLQNCKKLRKMPDSISNLTKLEILDVSKCENLSITPSFLSILARLTKLNMEYSLYPMSLDNLRGSPTKFFLAKTSDFGNYFTINLNEEDQLEGISPYRLDLACFENVNDPKDVANAHLWKKSNLLEVRVNWRHPNSPSKEEMSHDEEILEYLKLPASISTLHLAGYSARKFPSWLMNIHDYLSNISKLSLSNMKNCEHFPPLGHLPKLSELTLLNMPNLRKIDEALIGKRMDSYFGFKLSLISLLNLEEWSIGDATFGDMHIYECPKLRFEPLFPVSRTCFIERSPQVFYSRSSQNAFHFRLPTYSLTITHCDFETFPNIGQCMKSLEHLTINSCKKLKEIPPWFAELTSLRILYIRICNCMENLPLFLLDLPSVKLIYIESSNHTLLAQCANDNRLIVDAWNDEYEGEDEYEDKNPTLSRCWSYLDRKLNISNIDAGIGNGHDEDYKVILFDRIPPEWNDYDYVSSNGDYDMEASDGDSDSERDDEDYAADNRGMEATDSDSEGDNVVDMGMGRSGFGDVQEGLSADETEDGADLKDMGVLEYPSLHQDGTTTHDSDKAGVQDSHKDMEVMIIRNPVTQVNQEAHVASADPPQPSGGKKPLTAEEKGKGLLIESDKKQSRDVTRRVPLGGFMSDARNPTQSSPNLVNQMSPTFTTVPDPSSDRPTTKTRFNATGTLIGADTTTSDNQTTNKNLLICSNKTDKENHFDKGPQAPLNVVREPAHPDDIEMLNETFERLGLEKQQPRQGKRKSSTKEKDKDSRQKTTTSPVSRQSTSGSLNQNTQKSTKKWALCFPDEDKAVIDAYRKNETKQQLKKI